MTTAALAGSTGLVGTHILSTLLAHPTITSIYAFTRRALPTPPTPSSSPKLHPLTSADTSTWPALLPTSPSVNLYISSLGTTRAAAGSLDAQRKIDVDLNFALAKAARDAGVQTCVLVSVTGADSKASSAYTAMKGELEDKVRGLAFANTVFVRPGLLLGQRDETRLLERGAQVVAGVLGKVSPGWVEGWAHEAAVVARVAVGAGLRCVEGKGEGKDGVWEIEMADIARLEREWA